MVGPIIVIIIIIIITVVVVVVDIALGAKWFIFFEALSLIAPIDTSTGVGERERISET